MDSQQLSDRILDYAVGVSRVVDELPDTRLGRHIANQLVRSGTAPAPNYEEARGSESRRDFIHKLSICNKELRESRCWLRLIRRSGIMSPEMTDSVLRESNELLSIFTSSILTAKGKRRSGRRDDSERSEP